MVNILISFCPSTDARTYYLRLVLHAFQDSESVKILQQLYKAMKPGYSRLIIHEQVMSEETPSRWSVSVDLNEMASITSSERTEKEWEVLLYKAGEFESPKFYYSDVPRPLS